MLLKGKKILVHGVSNDFGMGWAIAKKLAEQGAELAIPYGAPAMEKRVRPLAESVGAKFIMECNVQDDVQMDALFDAIGREWGHLDGVVHAIAYSDKNELNGKYAETSRENFKNTMDISVYSMVDLTNRAAKLMKNGGAALTLTYFGGEKYIPNYNVMAIAKSALDSSVRYLANDFGPNGIRVNAISAGPIKTLASSGVGGFKSILDLTERITPLRRNMTLEDVAGAALYLMSDLSSGVTGEIHHVDCGYSTTGMIPTEISEIVLKHLED